MTTILITNGAILSAAGWIPCGYLWIEEGRIGALGADDPPRELLSRADQILNAHLCAVLPGFTNAHTHFSQTFMRGLAGGRPLLEWLKNLIWPLQNALSPEDMRLATMLGLVENLRSGVTHVVDHHKVAATPAHTDAVLQSAQQVGLRLTLARSWADMGTNAESPASILFDLERLFTTWHTSTQDRVQISNGPLVPWRCSEDTLQKTHTLAQKHSAATHIHVSETEAEVQFTLDATGLRPVAWLDSLGILGPHSQIVHAVWLDEAELDLLADRQAPIVHCPLSNAVLGSGIAPLRQIHQRQIPISLGSDGPASNDTQDIFECMKWALGLSRASSGDPTCLSPGQVLRMATKGRTLQIGAPADVILVDLNHTRAMPVHDLDSALVLCCHSSDVDTVIVGGELLMQQKQILNIDEAVLLAECRAAANILR
ncbi:MAG: amidohydrolase, partial [Anaerolineales bacterium]|nr:amidohydrolase [Anaerolineales bacterium]